MTRSTITFKVGTKCGRCRCSLSLFYSKIIAFVQTFFYVDNSHILTTTALHMLSHYHLEVICNHGQSCWEHFHINKNREEYIKINLKHQKSLPLKQCCYIPMFNITPIQTTTLVWEEKADAIIVAVVFMISSKSPNVSKILDILWPRLWRIIVISLFKSRCFRWSNTPVSSYFSTAVQFDKRRICTGLISIWSAYKCAFHWQTITFFRARIRISEYFTLNWD